MPKKIDMIGKKFGRWTVKEEARKGKNGGFLWRCVCDCGAEKIVQGGNLRNGTSQSCGCLQRELVSRKGNKHPSWKGGSHVQSAGYRMIYNSEHPRSHSYGYVFEHIVLAEKALGKPLPVGAEIHHYGDKGNNGKIVICQDRKYHSLLHTRARALEVCGNANYRKCNYCKKYDDQKNLYIKGNACCHRECRNEYLQERKAIMRANILRANND